MALRSCTMLSRGALGALIYIFCEKSSRNMRLTQRQLLQL